MQLRISLLSVFSKSITRQTSKGRYDHLVMVDMKPNSRGSVDTVAVHRGDNASISNFELESGLP